jgi:probable HAF family extracellular repeat protein
VTKFFLPLILAAGMHAVSVQAQPKYTATAICEGYGEGINSNGDICGGSTGGAIPAPHAFLYKRGKLIDLGVDTALSANFPKDTDSTEALAVNNSDFVVGELADVPNGGTFFLDSFVYLNGKIVSIAGGSQDGGFASAAWAVNNSGWVVGSYDAGGTVTVPVAAPGSANARAFLYRNGITYDLGTLDDAADSSSQAFDVNNAGQIVGAATTVNGINAAWYGFLYRNGKMQAIGGASSNRSVPTAINDSGWIAGSLWASPVIMSVLNGGPDEVEGSYVNGVYVENTSTAVLYVNGRFTNIPNGVSVISINNNGIVIGYGTAGSGIFVYGNGKAYDLNALVQGNWTITNVGHINDSGQIAATGIVKGSTNGVTYALLLSPAGSSSVPR